MKVTSISSGLLALEPGIAAVEENLSTVEKDVNSVKANVTSNSARLTKLENNPGSSMEVVVAEVNDRASRMNNVLLQSVPASPKADTTARKEDDRYKICTTF